jgi:anti-sigma regulatory factor (Ser/Thr protein kinase)
MTADEAIHPCILRRDVPAKARAVERLCRDIRAFLIERGLLGAAFAVELTARECLINALEHGNQRRAGSFIQMELRVGRVWIQLSVTDQGRGFKWRRNRNLAGQESTGGRGLAICTHYAARTAFNRRGNRITLWLSKAKKEC